MRSVRTLGVSLAALAALAALGVLAVLTGLRPLGGTAQAAPRQPSAEPGPVIIIGVPGLTWDQISEQGTPAIWRLLERGSAGSLSVRAAGFVTCPDAGWLTLGAGNRAEGDGAAGEPCGPLPAVLADGEGARVPAVPGLREANDKRDDDARVGELGDALARSGRCITAVGPGAALAAADGTGAVAVYRPTPGSIGAGLLGRCPVTIVDAAAGTVAASDAVVASVDTAAPHGATVLLAGVADTAAAPERPARARLHVAMAAGPGFGEHALVSASTRRAPFVQLIDIAPTVLRHFGVPAPDNVIGQPWRSTSGSHPGVASLADLDRAATGQRNTAVPFFVIIGVLLGLFLVAAALAARGGRVPRRVTRVVGTALALTLPASFLATLVPWWRAGGSLAQLGALVGVTAVWTAVLTTLAFAHPWRDRFGHASTAAALVAITIGADLLAGAPLQMFSPAGYSPLVAGRFAGIGNVAFGIFAAGVLLAAAGAASAVRAENRRAAVIAAGAVGVAGIAVDGAPIWGSDVGGVLALVPAVVVLCLLVSGARVSWRWLVGGCLAAVAVVAILGVVDYNRPQASRTHLGRFVGDLLHGDGGGVIGRKLSSNAHLLTSNVGTMLVPVLVLAAGWLLFASGGPAAVLRRRVPSLRHGLIATWVAALVGFFANDSGVAVPALAAAVAVPLAVAALVRMTCDDASQADGAPSEPPQLLR